MEKFGFKEVGLGWWELYRHKLQLLPKNGLAAWHGPALQCEGDAAHCCSNPGMASEPLRALAVAIANNNPQKVRIKVGRLLEFLVTSQK